MQLRDELHGSRQPSYRGTSTKDADVSRAVCCRCTDVNACWQIKPRGDSHENAWTSDACGAPLQGLLIMECLLRWRHSSRSEEHTSELQSQSNLVCRLLLEKKKTIVNMPGSH